jgi:hypothetical protein
MKFLKSSIVVLALLVLMSGGIYLMAGFTIRTLFHLMFPYAQKASELEINSRKPSSLPSSRENQIPETNSSPILRESPSPLPKRAMTWRVLNTMEINGKKYALFGSDNLTNPYQGDSDINQEHSLLCLSKRNLPVPTGLPSVNITPGGASRGTWSGGEAVVVLNIQANKLTSQASADEVCRSEGQRVGGIDAFRMAEFHDGDQSSGIAGWDFWAEVSSWDRLDNLNNRYWVRINDQAANPW